MEATTYTFPETLWAGTDHSLAIAREAFASMMAKEGQAALMAGAFGQSSKEEDEGETPHNYKLQGNIGIVTIAGSLTNRDSFWNRYMGVTSYGDVRRAMAYAAGDVSAKAILLDINSGGGAVSGLDDAAAFIAKISKDVKDVYAFTDSVMMSAAYWLGSSAKQIFMSRTAMAGSIGVMATHMEYSKQLKAAGVGVTIIRAGEYKALANSMEPLTEAAVRQLQDQANASYQIFLAHVASHRGMTVEAADQKIAQGREFFGKSAHDVGLVDGIKTFEATIDTISKKVDKVLRSNHNPAKYLRGESMATGKVTLSEKEIAALAAGAVTPEIAAKVKLLTADAGTGEADEVTPEPVVAPVVAAAVVAPAADAGVQAYLQGQITELNAKVLDLTLKLTASQSQATRLEATHAPLLKIAGTSLSTMKVALGSSALDLTTLQAEVVIAEHAATSKKFTETFATGGVAAVSATADVTTPKPSQNHLARIEATRMASN